MVDKEARQSPSNWWVIIIGWSVALLILFALAYKLMFQKQLVRTVDCLDQAASAQRATSSLTSVEKYAACIAWASGGTPTPAGTLPARCRYAGVWTATRGNMAYEVTLEADGKFVAEPGQNVPENQPVITGAWAAVGNSLVWAYDSGAVWPPNINPISAESEKAFTLMEVNGSTTRYALIERSTSGACVKNEKGKP